MNGVSTSLQAIPRREHLRQSVNDILSTPVGSQLMRRNYGSNLFELMASPQNAHGRMQLIAAAVQAIMTWEPRLSIKRIQLTGDVNGQFDLTVDAVDTGSGDPVRLDRVLERA
jgi:hypothetical protein